MRTSSLDAAALLAIGAGLVEAQAVGVNPGATIGAISTSTEAAPNAGATQVVAFDPDIVGTWSSKSNKTFTGPGFYNPKRDELIEPSHTGISYSFTDDGHYEVAYYRAIANPVNPACPAGIMQWQHGKYQILANGSLITQPYEVDGRQLLSEPCNSDNALYTRFNQSEVFERYEQFIDPYHNIPRLNLFRFDGSPIMPLYIAYRPPQMLPTTTLNPTAASNEAQATSTGTPKLRFKRGLEDIGSQRVIQPARKWVLGDAIWWFGIGATGVGSVMYFCF